MQVLNLCIYAGLRASVCGLEMQTSMFPILYCVSNVGAIIENRPNFYMYIIVNSFDSCIQIHIQIHIWFLMRAEFYAKSRQIRGIMQAYGPPC